MMCATRYRPNLPNLQHDFYAACDLMMRVADLMHDANNTLVTPAITARSADIYKKADNAVGGDFVLSIDLNCEAFFRQQLQALIPGSVCVGEESFDTASRAQMDAVTSGVSWIVDPLDGTNNVKRALTDEGQTGEAPRYGIMVALLHKGLPEASWILTSAPKDTDGNSHIDVACATRGHGSFQYDEQIASLTRIRLADHAPDMMRVATFPPTYPAPFRELIETQMQVGAFTLHMPAPKSAAHETMLFLQGEVGAAAFRQYRLWDHLPGQLLVEEAGGIARLFNGRKARLNDHKANGMLFAHDSAHWQDVRHAMLGHARYTHTDNPAPCA